MNQETNYDKLFKRFCILTPVILAILGIFIDMYKWYTAFRPGVYDLSTFIIMQFSLNYEYGLTPRGLINEIVVNFVNFAFDGKNYLETQMVLRYVTIVLFDVYFLRFIYKKGTELRKKYGHIIYPIILFSMFFVFQFFVVTFDYASYDVYLVALMFMSLCFIHKDKPFLIIIPMVLMMFLHEGSLFMFMPVIYAFLLKKTINADRNTKIKYWSAIMISGILMSAIFIYFSMFAWRNHTLEQYDEYMHYLMNLYAMPQMGYGFEFIADETFVKQEFLGAHLSTFDPSFYKYPVSYAIYCWATTGAYLLIYTPILIGLRGVYSKFRLVTQSKIDKLKYALILIAQPLALLPFIVLKTDEGRWFRDIVLYYLILFFYKLYTEDCSEIVEILKTKIVNLYNLFKASLQNKLCLIVWFIFLYPGCTNSPSTLVHNLVVITYLMLK